MMMTMPIDRSQITGVVLAGGRGSRMGGVDKGLQMLGGRPLAWHALRRLRPQVGALMINANRNLDAYRALSACVVTDASADHPGPLAGFLAGLEGASTPYVAFVPCDSPLLPADLVARLAQALDAHADDGADLAMAAVADLNSGRAGDLRPQPVFSLLRRDLRTSLRAALAAGERKVGAWCARQRQVLLRFDDAAAFANVNTADELAALQARAAPDQR